MIVATAGHVDHGKTTLVRTLTGIDTDRLPEEKARGISIDLGFAYWTTDRGDTVGFVDVPGHERFVRNMLAGVCAIDYVLFVVAADDGVMPQTVEHLQIVDLLGVREGTAVVTKADRVPEARLAEVTGELRALLQGTSLSAIDILPISPISGLGMTQLRSGLAAAAARHDRSHLPGRALRFAVDRAFAVTGTGTVVTGTIFAGAVATGDHVVLSPSGLTARVRGLQAQGKPVPRAQAGQRCALNLANIDLGQVVRGDWVLDPDLHGPTRQIDVRLKLLRGENRPMRHWTPVHVHLGTSDVLGRVAMARDGSMEPGGSGVVRLALERAIVAGHGDRFIVRDQSATRTLGGGIVIDPHPPRRRRNSPLRDAQLSALEHSDPAEALAALRNCSPAGLDTTAFRRSFGLAPAMTQALLEAGQWTPLAKESYLAWPNSLALEAAGRIVEAIHRFHASMPQAFGYELAALRGECGLGLSSVHFAAFVRRIAAERRLEVRGSLVRLIDHEPTDNPVELKLWQKIKVLLEAAGLPGIDVPTLAQQTGGKEAMLRDLMHRKARARELFLVAPDLFFSGRTLATFAVGVAALAARQADGKFTAAAVRDELGASRARTVQLLECLDRLGITLRNGNVRTVRQSPESVLGERRLAESIR